MSRRAPKKKTKGRPQEPGREAEKPEAAPARRQRKPLSGKQKLLLIGFGPLLLIVAELVLRVAGIGGAGYDPLAGFTGQALFERGTDEAGRDVHRVSAAFRKAFNDERFAAARGDEHLRVFCLGGSSTYGFPTGAEIAFPRWLAEWLGALESLQGRDVEVVNVGGVSYASHRLRLMLPELLSYEPDLIVVYSGHNEFVEKNFYEDVLQGESGWVRLDSKLAGLSRLYGVTRSATRGAREVISGPPAAAEQDLAFQVVVRRRTEATDEASRAAAIAGYRANLAAMVAQCRAADVPIVLLTTPPNLRDWSPDGSVQDGGLSTDELARFGQLVRDGMAALDTDDAGRAVEHLRAAVAIDGGHAETWYRLARAEEMAAAGEYGRAAAAYSRARDLDALPIRALSGMEAAVRELGVELDVPVIDVTAAFERESEHGLIGADMVMDYVHPTVRGHQVIARELARWAVESGVVPGTGAELDRVAGPLESEQEAERQAIEARASESPTEGLNRAFALRNQGELEEATAAARSVVNQHPRSAVARYALATLFWERGLAVQAESEYRASLDIDPDDDRVLSGMGVLLMATGRADQAEVFLRRAFEQRPGDASTNGNLGKLYGVQGRNEEALPFLEKATALAPDDIDARVDLGALYLRMERPDEALGHFQAALAREPAHAIANYNTCLVLAAQGDEEGALRHLRVAADATPPAPGAPMRLLRLLQRDEEHAEVAELLERAIAAFPHDREKLRDLAWLLATCPDDAVRDGERATEVAKRLCTATNDHAAALMTLAAAHAEAGRFDEAVAVASRARDRATGMDALVVRIEEHLVLYQQRKPVRTP